MREVLIVLNSFITNIRDGDVEKLFMQSASFGSITPIYDLWFRP